MAASDSPSLSPSIAPEDSIAWGEESPDAGTEPLSWQRWQTAADTPVTVDGDPDWGSCEVNEGTPAYGDVIDTGDALTKEFTVTTNVYDTGTGDAVISVRGSDTVFAQHDLTPAWTGYAAPITRDWRYVQLKMEQGSDMPLGIPAPPFGYYEARPATPDPWTSEVAGYYYVDYVGGTNTGRTYGTPAAPRKTIPTTLPAGSVVVLKAGTNYSSSHYAGGGGVLTAQGTAEAPVWIMGEDPDSRSVVTRRWELKGPYLVIDNVDWSMTVADAQVCLYVGGVGDTTTDHFVLRHCDLNGNSTGNDGLTFYGADYVVIHDVVIRYMGDWTDPTIDADHTGINLAGHCEYFWVLNSEIWRCQGSGLQANSASARYIYFGFNEVHECHQSGFWIKYSTDAIVSQNDFHDMVEVTDSDSRTPSMGCGWQYGGDNIWIIFNRLHGNQYGIRPSSYDNPAGPGTCYVVGNLIYDNHQWGAVWSSAGIDNEVVPYLHVVGNSFYDNDSNITCGAMGGTLFSLKNNIFGAIANAARYHIQISDTAATVIENNFFQPAAKVQWGSGGPVYESVAALIAATGQGTDCHEGDPLYTNAPSDMSLQADSPAIDEGAVSDVYATFESTWGRSIAKDFAGAPRPVGGVWDMGAHEYQG